MAVAVQQSSAANLLALLDEEDDALKLYALQSLNKVVHQFWFQIASAIASVEAFYEDEGFSHRELAALVASKVRGLPGSQSVLLPLFNQCQMPLVEYTVCRAVPMILLPLWQVFYHLGELDDALTYALGAGKLFDINEQSEYVQTTLGAFGECQLNASPSHSRMRSTGFQAVKITKLAWLHMQTGA